MGDFEVLYKLLVIGNSGVGKTSLLMRYVEDKFASNLLNTVGKEMHFACIRLFASRAAQLSLIMQVASLRDGTFTFFRDRAKHSLFQNEK